MRRFIPGVVVSLLLAGCAATPPAGTVAATCAHSGPAPVLRAGLPAKFGTSSDTVRWPPDDGFGPATLTVTIKPGALLDRYGDGAGKFLSPKGTGYRERSLPWECRGYTYTTYQVVQPLPALLGTAAPWFGEPGGAVQVETTDCVNQLVAAGVLTVVAGQQAPACPVS